LAISRAEELLAYERYRGLKRMHWMRKIGVQKNETSTHTSTYRGLQRGGGEGCHTGDEGGKDSKLHD